MPEMTNSELDFVAARGTVYRFLSMSLSEPPTREILQALVDALADGSMATSFEESARSALENLHVCAKEALASEAKMKELRQEFMDLFKVPAGRYVTPYESVYRDSWEIEGTQVNGLLMGPSAVDAQRWYRLGAAEMTDQIKELPDHIAVELGFMAYLCGKEQEFESAGDDVRAQRAREMERDFLKGHVLSWIGELSDRIRKKTDHPYFHSLSQLLLALARLDLSLLECPPHRNP